MNRSEAKQAMLNGATITHRYFSDDKYIKMEKGKVVDENGYRFFPDDFWRYRQDEAFNKDWSIKEVTDER